MNRVLKWLLIALGLTVAVYAWVWPVMNIDSPRSAWEHSMLVEAHRGDAQLLTFFRSILARIRNGWWPFILLGLFVAIAASLVKTPRSSDKRLKQ
ncbi:MAG TPA: hypothetical protein VI454_17635 [Verrucomicrobiae bacterium]|jgi:hypothetical protein